MKNKKLDIDKSIKRKDSEHAYLLALFDNTTIGMVVYDLEGFFLEVNAQFVKMLGYSEEELRKMTFNEITHSDDLEADLENVKDLLNGKRKDYQKEKRFISKDEHIIWVNILTSIVHDSENKPEVFVGTIEDISDKKKSIQEFEKSRTDFREALRLLQSIQNSIPDVIGVQDLKHNIIQYNDAGYAMLNKTFDEVEGKKCYELIGRTKQCELCSTAEAIKTGKPVRHEQYFPELDNWLDMRAYPVFDENSEIIYLVEHLRDITDYKKLEIKLKKTIDNLEVAKEKAEESDNLKTAFLHNISHEIRTPLNGILGFSELMKNEESGNERIRKYLDIIVSSGWQLSNIISDLVSIATIESGQEKAHVEKTNIQDLLQKIYSSFLIKAEEKDLYFRFMSDISDVKYIITDETKLFQILSNLVENAIKYTNNGCIELGASKYEDKLEFYVKDTGIGIKKDDFDKIFVRFSQVNSTGDNLYRGSGLGLSICKAYIELLGGRIWLESKSNEGSTFYFNIPLITQ